MTVDLVSLATIALVAAACPLAARLIPNKLVPETVFLLAAGALLGPHLAQVIRLTDSVNLLSELGLAFLFLLAGYEINPKNLTGSQGKRGLGTWIVSFAAALLVVSLLPALSSNHFESIAMAIALTTTALGTLMPILKERELMETRVGESILAYGTWGELCPILAMALLLSSRAEWKTMLILLAFGALCALVAVVPARARKAGHRLFKFLSDNADTTSQTMMRVTVLLLVGLVTLSAVFDLDIVLGAFAAGFVLRYIIPEGNDSLEKKLDGLAYGFLIPVFFVVSGAKIDLMAVFSQPLLLVGFIAMLLLVRAVPIFVALSTGKDTHDLSSHNRLTVALYCTTALPIIVAVTSVAVDAGAMTQETAGTMVAAGAVTVFLMPLLASITYRVADAKPLEAVKEIRQNPRDIGDIVREHMALERMLARQEAAARLAARHRRRLGIEDEEEVPWEELAASLQRVSVRKRVLDEALDLAAQELAAKRAATDDMAKADVIESPEEHGQKETPTQKRQRLVRQHVEWRDERRDEIRRRVAERAVREYNRRIAETSCANDHAAAAARSATDDCAGTATAHTASAAGRAATDHAAAAARSAADPAGGMRSAPKKQGPHASGPSDTHDDAGAIAKR